MRLIGNRVDMAIGTGKFRKIGRVLVTFIALHPLSLVLPTVDWEILGIMLDVLRGGPVRIGGMATDAVSGKIGLLVIGVYRTLIIRLMASHTTRGRIGKTAPDMAFRAIHIIVPLGQRKKIVFHFGRPPAATEQVVAFRAIGGKACKFVVGVGGCIVIIQVATCAIIPDPLKLKIGSGLVTLCTIQRLVYAR